MSDHVAADTAYISTEIVLSSSISALEVFPATLHPALPQFIKADMQVDLLEYTGGSEQRIMGCDEERWTIDLFFPYLTQTEKNTIMNFFILRKGAGETFYWCDSDGIPRIVRFVEDIMDIEFFRDNLYGANTVRIIETYWSAS